MACLGLCTYQGAALTFMKCAVSAAAQRRVQPEGGRNKVQILCCYASFAGACTLLSLYLSISSSDLDVLLPTLKRHAGYFCEKV